LTHTRHLVFLILSPPTPAEPPNFGEPEPA
jgi:hypothetical protein